VDPLPAELVERFQVLSQDTEGSGIRGPEKGFVLERVVLLAGPVRIHEDLL
jgi:hypothetical protein